MEINGSNNHRFLYQQDQHTITSRSSSASLHDLHQQYQYERQHRRPDQGGGFFSVHNKTRSVFVILLLLLLLLLILQFALPTIWQPTTIKSMPWIMMGRNKNINHNNWGSDDEKDDTNDTKDKNRSYQDLADSIKRLRIRREGLIDENIEEWGEGKDERQINSIDDKTVHRNNVGHDDLTNNNNNEIIADDDTLENIRLKRLEQKIQLEQKRKVRQEFASSKENNSNNDSSETDTHKIDDTSLKDKEIAESIAALKLLNENKNKKGV